MPGSPHSGLRKARVLHAASGSCFHLSWSPRLVVIIPPPCPLAKGDTHSHYPPSPRSQKHSGQDAGQLLDLPVLRGVRCPGGRGCGLLPVLVSVAVPGAGPSWGRGPQELRLFRSVPPAHQLSHPQWDPRGRWEARYLSSTARLLPTSPGPFGDYPALQGTLFCLERSGRCFCRFRPLTLRTSPWLSPQLTSPRGGCC